MGHLSGLVDLVRAPSPATLVASLVTAGLLLGGCSSSPTADPTASPTPSASTTARVAPPLPPAAQQHTKAGAIAFVRHYVDLINYAQETGDDQAVRRLSASGCNSCKSAARFMRHLRRTNGSIEGGRWRVQSVLQVLPSGQPNELSVPLSVHYGPQDVRVGTKTTHYAGGNNVFTFFPAWGERHWVMNAWTRAK